MKYEFSTGVDPSVRASNPTSFHDDATVIVANADDKLLLHVSTADDARRLAQAFEAAAVALDRARESA